MLRAIAWAGAAIVLVAAACAAPETAPPPPPLSPRLLDALAAIELARERDELAPLAASLRADAAKAPKDPVAAFLAAAAAGEAEPAWKEHRKAADRFPTSPWPYAGMARGELTFKAWDQVERSLAKATSLAPHEPLPKLLRAELLRLTDRPEEARALLEELLGSAPDLAEAHAGLGAVLADEGDLARARAALERALALRPERPDVARRLAALCEEARDAACAKAAWATVARLVPADGSANLSVARTLEAQGDAAGAFRAYEAAGVLEGEDVAALEALARLAGKLAAPDRELAALRRLDQVRPKSPPVLRRIAVLVLAGGDAKAARAAWRAVLAEAPEDPAAHGALGRFAREEGRLREAVAGLRRAAAAGDAAARAELVELEKELALAAIDGKRGVADVAGRVMEVASKLASTRRRTAAVRGGKVVARVSVASDGTCEEVAVLEDGVRDELLVASIYWNLKDARYPAGRADYKVEIPIK